MLENGWTVGTGELIKLFDMLELKAKVVVSDEYQAFIEFCYLLALLLKVDEDQIEQYFAQDSAVSDFLQNSLDSRQFN